MCVDNLNQHHIPIITIPFLLLYLLMVVTDISHPRGDDDDYEEGLCVVTCMQIAVVGAI